MIAIFSLLVTLVLSLLVTRIGAMSLMLTGLSSETAKFQARSAYCGVGFTTDEAESIMDHPVRRRIIYTLMLLGNIGLATVTASTIASLLQAQDKQTSALLENMGILSLGLLLLWLVSRSRYVERQLNKIISWSLRRFSHLQARDYVSILNLQKGFAVFEIRVDSSDWLADKTLRDLRLTYEGVLVLGIRRSGGTFIGAPKAETHTVAGDTLVLYGPMQRLTELDGRKAGSAGDIAHLESIKKHEKEKRDEADLDPVDQN